MKYKPDKIRLLLIAEAPPSSPDRYFYFEDVREDHRDQGVYDVVHDPLVEAGLPVVPVRVPFPGSGQQRRFVEAFEKALETAPH